jgi:hypothetical protein
LKTLQLLIAEVVNILQAQEVLIWHLFDAGGRIWTVGKTTPKSWRMNVFKDATLRDSKRKPSMAIATRNQQMPQRSRRNREDRASAGYVTHSDITQHVQAQAKDLCVTSEYVSSGTSGHEPRFRTADVLKCSHR